MRITKLNHGENCPDDCVKMYCKIHRLIFNTCNTGSEATEGDRDVIGGTRVVMEYLGECPDCVERSWMLSEKRKWEEVSNAPL